MIKLKLAAALLALVALPAPGALAGPDNPSDPCWRYPHTVTNLAVAAAGTVQLAPGASGKTIRVCSLYLNASGSNSLTFVEGTGTNCGTGQTSAYPTAYSLAGGQALTREGGDRGGWFTTANPGDALCLTTTTSGTIAGAVETVTQ